jgi:hypothetical protein
MANKYTKWNPAKTFDELKKQPFRVLSDYLSGGANELPTIIGQKPVSTQVSDAVTGQGAGGILSQSVKKIGTEGIVPNTQVSNPFAQALQNQVGLGQGAYVPNYNANPLSSAGGNALLGLIPQLQSEAAGTGIGQTLAQRLMQEGLQQNIQGVQSNVLSQRGLNPAMQAQLIAQQSANLGQQTAAQAGNLGLQQQLGAESNLGTLGNAITGLGNTQASSQAGANLNYLNTLAGAFGTAQGQNVQNALGQGQIAAGIANTNANIAASNLASQRQILGGLIGGGASMGAAALTPKSGGTAAAGGAGEAGAGEAGAAGAEVPAAAAVAAAEGGRIGGVAEKAGDSYQNDTVSAELSPGEIVIPRSAAFDKNKAKKFLDALDDWDDKASYTKVLKARANRK